MIEPAAAIDQKRLWMAKTVVAPTTRFMFCKIYNPNKFAIGSSG
jgi:hypothetical protein